MGMGNENGTQNLTKKILFYLFIFAVSLLPCSLLATRRICHCKSRAKWNRCGHNLFSFLETAIFNIGAKATGASGPKDQGTSLPPAIPIHCGRTREWHVSGGCIMRGDMSVGGGTFHGERFDFGPYLIDGWQGWHPYGGANQRSRSSSRNHGLLQICTPLRLFQRQPSNDLHASFMMAFNKMKTSLAINEQSRNVGPQGLGRFIVLSCYCAQSMRMLLFSFVPEWQCQDRVSTLVAPVYFFWFDGQKHI